MSDTLRELARPFPSKYVHTNPSGGGSYVKHHVVEQRLIQVLGVPPSFKMVELLRGDADGFTAKNGTVYPDLTNVIVGVVARMEVTIDGNLVTVEECGDCEQPHNWKTDGQRLKDAMSDAYKRAAMRLGCGLALWSQNEFFLFDELSKLSEGGGVPIGGESAAADEPHVTPPSGSSPGPEPSTPQEASPGSGEPPWYQEAVKKHGAQKVKGIATAFSKNGAKVTRLDQLDAATEEQRSEVLKALADLDWAAPEQGAMA